MSIPASMKAVVIEGSNAVVKENVPLPPVKEGQVLVKTLAVAVNPTDWKHIEFKIGPQGAISGCDAAGQVVKVGANVKNVAEGDVVAGFVHGASVNYPENGAFAQYTAVDSELVWKLQSSSDSRVLSGKDELPSGPVSSLEGLVTFPISLNTAGIVLVNNLKIDLNWKSSKPQRDEPVIVWGGATAFGQCFIQLAKQLNAFSKIVTVASRKHEALLKKYGADQLFDYHDSDVLEQIKKEYPEQQVVVDAVSNPETYPQIYKVTADTKPAVIINLIYLDDKNVEKPKSNVRHESTMLYLITGHDVPFGPLHLPKDLEYRKAGIDFIKWVQPKIDSGEIHHMPVRISNGLGSIPKLLDDVRTGRNAGVKLVAVL
ncbi:hypothetical protein ZYGR_0AV02490 [Zygosaccharomyces rouxii]|uniref:Enoyl reductase (ER) domain-containing protein n=1 Tax=Zygosaccharomyces rouxii TaxID=4956 RepID=A0A1B4X9B7_ZYGRO|nr:HEMF synthase 1 [Codonopsis lanceolata]WCP17010.1 HEMF synthase 1 [Zygosaccharomyces rouxii]BAV31390.1 hypothetical protein [Zygosaccharomyces rouxii]GAV50826.1 hypothetical protein ZYGR_0AA00140 [Zygosaccharomyces rouxii]GAV55617.1 hypothetical protein ZYGR_0AV02490 [Zygosaccharomyces rouxii]